MGGLHPTNNPTLQLEDSLWGGLEDQHVKMPMAITAENLADMHGITREECDNYAIQSQQRWGAAQQAGRCAVCHGHIIN